MRSVFLYIVFPFALILSQFASLDSDHPSSITNPATTTTQKPPQTAPWLKMNSGDGLLVINEIDYDQNGNDVSEFIEIKNISTSPVDLSIYSIVLINGATGLPYQTYPLSSALGPGSYYVLCGNSGFVQNCDQDITPNLNFIQNGAPDGIILLNTVTGVNEDAVSYEGTIPGVTEFSGVGLNDNPSFANYGLSRVPDGNDTDANNQDFVFQCISPGATNSDNQQPELVCPSDMVIYSDEFCEADLPDFTGSAFVSDNCPANIVLSQSPSAGISVLTGTHTVSITANDGSTTPVTCSFNVAVLDTIPPTLTACPGPINLNASSGACFQDHSFQQNNFSGDFSTSNWNWNPAGSATTEFAFSGNTTLSLTSSNDNGNSCPPPFFHAGVISVTTLVTGLVTFNWSFETFDSSPLFDPFGFAVNGSFFQLSDNNGPAAQSGSFSVPLSGGDSFAFITASLDECNNSSIGTITNFIFYPGFLIGDNCPGTISIEGIRSDGLTLNDSYPVCETTVNWIVTDNSGNNALSSCETVVNVNENIAPTAACLPGPITIGLNSSGTAELLPELIDAGSLDNCSPVTLSIIDPNGFGTQFNCSDLGQGILDYLLQAEDCSGNIDLCSATVQVLDQTPPQWDQAAGQFDMTFSCHDDLPDYVAQVTAGLLTASDNADACFTPVISIFSDDTTGMGSIPCTFGRTLVFRATDGSGNTTGVNPLFPDYTLTLSVNDNVPPVFTDPPGALNVTLACEDSTGISAAINTIPSATDNCLSNGNINITLVADSVSINPVCPNAQMRFLRYLAIDACGNISADTFEVIVETIDNEAPAFTETPGALDVTLECDDTAGLATALAAIPGVEDNCSDAGSIQVTVINDNTTPEAGCPFGYTRVLEYQAVDPCGNASGVNYFVTITVEDTQQPQILTSPTDQQVECNGTPDPGSSFANWLNNFGGLTATDNCGAVSITMTDQNNTTVPRPADDPGFDVNLYLLNILTGCNNTGLVNMTFIVSDECGNFDTRIATYSIQDNDLPIFTVLPSDLTVQCDGTNDPGGAFNDWLATFAGAVASDDCGGVTLELDPPNPALPGFCGPAGGVTVEVVATDACGNEVRESATFVIIDTESPVIDVPPSNLTVECDGAGNVAEMNNWLASNGGASASDNCGSVIWITNPGSPILTPGCAATGSVDVEFIAIDICGLITSAGTATFTIEDTQAPLILTQASGMTVECDGTGFENQMAFWLSTNGGADASDGCGTLSWSNDFDPLNIQSVCGNTGTVEVKFFATDPCNNVDSTSAIFQLEDSTDPILTAPTDFGATTDPGQCCRSFSGSEVTAVVSDNCDPAPVREHSFDMANWVSGLAANEGPDGSGCFPVGMTKVYFRSTDSCSNQAVDSMTVTIEDLEGPTLDCPPDVSETTLSQLPPGDCSNVISWLTPVPTDNCAGVTISDPVADDPDIVFNINPVSGLVIAEFSAGTTNISYTATDAAGNMTTCTFTVTIIDNEVPLILSCPTNIVYSLDGGCNPALATVPDYSNQIQVLENCGYTVDQDPVPGIFWSEIPGITPGPGEMVQVTMTVEDLGGIPAIGGNTPDGSGCTFTVVFSDINAPTITCPADDVLPVSATNCSEATLPDYTGDAIVNDNCSQNVMVTQMPLPGQISTSPGEVITVTLTATDGSGNTESCSFSVQIIDGTEPQLSGCVSSVTVTANAGPCSADVALVPPTAADNCDGMINVTSERSDGLSLSSPYPVGTTTVTWSAVDLSGNADSCMTLVNVMDAEPPIALCEISISAALNPSGTVQVCAGSFDNGSFGICGTPVILEIQRTNSPLPPEPCLSFNCGDLLNSPIPITLYVSDGSGNTSICQSVLSIQDNIIPVILSCPQDQTGIFNDPQMCGAMVSLPPLLAQDNCFPNIEYSIDGSQTWIPGNNASGFYPVGMTIIDWRVSDNDGNEVFCQTTIEVADNETPVFNGPNPSGCPDNILISTDPTLCVAMVNYNPPVGMDNCPGAVTALISGSGTGADFPVGIHTEIFEVTDVAGNSTTCSFTITVEDNEAPTALCQDAVIFLNTNGQMSVTLSQIDNGSFDNCDLSPILQLNTNLFNCSNLGSNTVVLTVTDADGNTGTCAADVMVNDTIPPMITCQPVPHQRNSSQDISGDCAYEASNGEFDPATAMDNCPVTLSHDYASAPSGQTLDGAVFPVGSTTVMWTVTDQAGNTASCSEVIQINDDEMPACNAPIPVTVNTSTSGSPSCGAFVSLPPATTSDNCGINFLINNSPFADMQGADVSGTYPVGTTSIAWAAMDVNGNANSCFSSITVVDDIDPVITCPADTTVVSDEGLCAADVASIIASAFDNCTIDRIDFDISYADGTSGSGTSTGQPNTSMVDAAGSFPVGTNTIIFTAFDIYGNSSQCSVDVTVMDGEDPELTCPADQTRGTSDDNILSDCRYTVQGDEFNPTGLTDNCAVSSIAHDYAGGGNTLETQIFNPGATTVVWTVTDFAGNTSSCSFVVTIIDDELPEITCAPDGVRNTSDDGNTADCFYTIQGPEFDPVFTDDNCEILSIEHDFNGGGTSLDGLDMPVGDNSVVWTITDENGNVNTCEVMISVIDDQLPGFACPQDGTRGTPDDFLFLYDCFYTVQGPEFDLVVVNDNCPNVMITHDFTGAPSQGTLAGANLPSGATVITWTIADENGNTETCSFTVNVVDTENPIAGCVSITAFSLNQFGQLTIPQTVIDNVINTVSFDNCPGPLTAALSQSVFDCTDVGLNPITLTVTDAAGNTAVCFTQFDIQDNTLPECITQSAIISLDATGNAGLLPADVDGGSQDACGIGSMTVSPDNFDCTNVGSNQVTLTVTDVNGNVNACQALVTIEDITAPIAQCQAISVQLDGNGQVLITGAMIDNGSSDVCGIAALNLDKNSFDCSNLGQNPIILTVTDVNGNAATCETVVTVTDPVPPSAICQDFTLVLDVGGQGILLPGYVDGGSMDACQISDFAVSPENFDCSSVGANQVVLTVTDASGNSGSCTSVVAVEDQTPPIAMCQPVTIELDVNGVAVIIAAAVDNGSTDACGINSMTLSQEDFDCTQVGDQEITLTVTDNFNNVSSCNATVSVEDNILPTALCQNLTVQLDNGGEANILAQEANAGSGDNCGLASVTVDPAAFDCSHTGDNPVVLTVTDLSGNTSTCESVVTVEDNSPPEVVCQDFTLYLNLGGFATLNPVDVQAMVNDPCGISTANVSPDFFICNDIGQNSVVLTIADSNGNVSTCSSTVTVVDTIAPIVACMDVTVSVNSGGSVSVTFTDIDNGSSDPCGISGFSVTDIATGGPGTYGCQDVGTIQEVELGVTDINGNTATCIANVSVVDDISPVAVCVPSLVLTLNNAGSGLLGATDLNGGSSDNCTLFQATIGQALFNCTDIGTNLVGLIVTDASGNQNSCSTSVTVVDGTPPTALCQDVVVSLGPNGSVTVPPVLVDAGSFDECCIDTVTLSQTIFTLPGNYPVVLTVVDCSGNISTCTALIIVNPSTTVNFCPEVFIQGSFNPFTSGPNDRMRSTLNQLGLMPLTPPYTSVPWFYNGTESFAGQGAIPEDMVDWIMLVVRDGDNPSILLGQAAGILRTDGSVTDVNGNNIALAVNSPFGYYIEMHHRGHLPVVSAIPVFPDQSGTVCYDFTLDMELAYRNTFLNDDPMNQLFSIAGTFYGMVAGNVQTFDCQIDANDINLLFQSYNAIPYYGNPDVNMDGQVDANDVNLLFGNYNRNCHKPY